MKNSRDKWLVKKNVIVFYYKVVVVFIVDLKEIYYFNNQVLIKNYGPIYGI